MDGGDAARRCGLNTTEHDDVDLTPLNLFVVVVVAKPCQTVL